MQVCGSYRHAVAILVTVLAATNLRKASVMEWKKMLAVTLAWLVTMVSNAADHTKDSLDKVKKSVSEGQAVLLDVRELDEWNDGHIQGAKHLALSDLKKGANEKLKSTVPAGKIVYVHCAAGGRCLKAADLLKSSGYDIRPLKPGYDALVKAGFQKAK